MGRLLLKCQACGRYFATGLNVVTGGDSRRVHKFQGIPYRCTNCGEERDYGSRDLVDEGARVGGSRDKRDA